MMIKMKIFKMKYNFMMKKKKAKKMCQLNLN